jgi:hypothetical protein
MNLLCTALLARKGGGTHSRCVPADRRGAPVMSSSAKLSPCPKCKSRLATAQGDCKDRSGFYNMGSGTNEGQKIWGCIDVRGRRLFYGVRSHVSCWRGDDSSTAVSCKLTAAPQRPCFRRGSSEPRREHVSSGNSQRKRYRRSAGFGHGLEATRFLGHVVDRVVPNIQSSCHWTVRLK